MVRAAKKTKKNVKSKTKKKSKTGKTTKTGRLNESEDESIDLHSSLSDSIFKDSFDKFLGDRGDRRKQLNLKETVRASFNRDSSFECSSTISETSTNDLSVYLPPAQPFTVCSTPNFKFSHTLQVATPPTHPLPHNNSSDLFASYAGFESSVNGSRETNGTMNDRVVSLRRSVFKVPFNEFVSLGRGGGTRREKNWSSETFGETAETALEIVEQIDQNGSPGEACDGISLTTERRLSDELRSVGVDSLHTESSSIDDPSRVDVMAESASICTTVSSFQSAGHSCGDAEADESTAELSSVRIADSLQEESQFFRQLRNKQSRGSLSTSDTNSTQRSISSCEFQRDFSLAMQSIGQSHLQLTNDHDQTTSSHSCIDISSELDPSLSNVSRLSVDELSKLQCDRSSSTLAVKCEPTQSFSSIDNSINCSADASSRVQSSCSTTPSTHNKTKDNDGCFPPLPRYIIDMLNKFGGIDAGSFDCTRDDSIWDDSCSHIDNLPPEKSSDGSTLSETKHINDSDASNVSNSRQSHQSDQRSLNLSQLSENLSELHDSLDTEPSSSDCSSTATTVELIETSNANDCRQGNLSSDQSNSSQCSDRSGDKSVERMTDVAVVDRRKRTGIIDTNVSKRTRGGLKRLANEFKSPRNSTRPIVGSITERRKAKRLTLDVGALGDKSTNSTVIQGGDSFGTCSRETSLETLTTANSTIHKDNSEVTEQTSNSSNSETDTERTITESMSSSSTSLRLTTLPAIEEHKPLQTSPIHIQSTKPSHRNEDIENSTHNDCPPSKLITTLKPPPSLDADNPVPREHLSDISNKINCMNVTKRKRNRVVINLPPIMESSSPVVEQRDIDRTIAASNTVMNDERKLDAGATDAHSVSMQSGKWRRVLSMHRRHSISMRSAFLLEQTDVESINSHKVPLSNESHRQILRHSVSFNLSRDNNFADFNDPPDRRAARRRRTSVINPSVDVGRLTEFDFVSTYKARDTILRKCGQSEPLEFADIYSEGALRQCRKIGEGVYGEVFMNKTEAGRAIVLKIIPIEGAIEVNGEPQKRFDEVLSEIVIAQQLSTLRHDKEFMTSSFAEVVQVRCVQGRYPDHLIDLWELYRDNYQTENDHPEIFGDDQLYIVFELANGGQDLEAFQFTNALQSKSAFQQMALALAIAEQKLQFEHRDLHWGNILLSPTDDKFVHFKLNGTTLQIPSEGIKVTIIDYTLSRMLYDGIVLYNDLSNDEELFTAHGDYQFDIYRLMKANLANDWQRFEPFNNILWLHYIVDKLINGARYKNTKSRKHRLAVEELMVIRDEITNYKSAVDSVSNGV